MLPNPLEHPSKLLSALFALSGDERFHKLVEQAKLMEERGEKGMRLPSFFDAVEKRGIAIGEKRGEMNMLFSLVGDGVISIGTAAAKAGMTEEAFMERMRQEHKV
ncbi:MAG: hypothetical protein IJR68_13710 [Fretibacterium sp.]|nr:hypothetical protein [Fretibacterium sp.]